MSIVNEIRRCLASSSGDHDKSQKYQEYVRASNLFNELEETGYTKKTREYAHAA